MAIVRPFPAIMPDRQLASKVLALPYDVMNREEARNMAEGNPFSFLHISRSEIDLRNLENPYCEQVYNKAKTNLSDFLSKGILTKEGKPMFYIYKQVMNGNTQIGLVGCVSIDDYINNVIKKHEHTRVEKEEDRIKHFDTCNANTEPVFLMYKDKPEIQKLIDECICQQEARFHVMGSDGVSHTLWAIKDNAIISGIAGLFDKIPSLYIADGHHRSASACKVGLKRRAENPNYTGKEEFNYFMAVIYPESHLKVFDYNRVLKDLNGHTEKSLLLKIREAGFLVECKGTQIYRPEGQHIFAMNLKDKWYKVSAKPEIIPDDVVESLDVSILQNHILDPIFGIEDPRTDKRIDFIGGIRGLQEIERRIKTDMEVGFAVYPVAVDTLMSVSDQNRVMPPKSTWFEPKIGSGLFVHQL